eukprot:4264617-Pyramimonas_sp.AAC.1
MSHPASALPEQSEHEILIPWSSYPDSQWKDSPVRGNGTTTAAACFIMVFVPAQARAPRRFRSSHRGGV